jgi:FixJ family two-component response regulator
VIHAFALRETNTDSGRTALVIEPAKSAEVVPIIIEAYQLGSREQQVTKMVAGGLRTGEIAAKLCLSTHTPSGTTSSKSSRRSGCLTEVVDELAQSARIRHAGFGWLG